MFQMPQLLDWIGYIASLVVLISLLMSSVKKLRWINLLGSFIFGVYGFLIGSLPVGLMNIGIAAINMYYLYQMYAKEDYFKLLPVKNTSDYMQYFIQTYQDNMKHFITIPKDINHPNYLKHFILRDTLPAGIFIVNPIDDKTLEIVLDYVTPTYQDFKLGNFIFKNNANYFTELGYDKFISVPHSHSHEKYLLRMGFTKNGVYYQKEV